MRPLEEIIEDYENTRQAFKNVTSKGDQNKDVLLEFQHRFIDLRADLRYWHTQMLSASENRSDKNATAIKMRIACSMVKDEYVFEEGTSPLYDNAPSISNAEKFAGGSKEYKEFLKQRTFFKESFVNVADLREDLQNYIILTRAKIN